MTLRWPCNVLQSRNIAADIASRSLAGPAAVSGVSQVVSSDAGIWKVTLGEIVIRKREHVLAFRAIANLLEGRLGTILVPLCRAYQPISADGSGYEAVPHSDDTFFSDGTGYVGTVISVHTTSAAPVRAVSFTASVDSGHDIEPGQHFSIGEWLYRVRTYDSETGAMTFRPPLREAVSNGTELNFDDPVCRMRLATDSEMDLELSMRRFGSPSVNFIEAL